MSPAQEYHNDPHALHTSRRETLQRCPRRFYIEYVLGLERIRENPQGMRMGNGHAVGLEHRDPNAVLNVAYLPLIEAASDERSIEELGKEARIVSLYVQLYLEIYPEVTTREIIWDLPIPGSSYRNCGTMDFQVELGGRLYGGEDKMYSQWSDQKEQDLDLDDQVTGEIYSMVAQGLEPAGLKYRVTKKASIRQRMVRNPETFDEYLERLEDKLRTDISDHFLEFTLTRTSSELREFEEELVFAGDYIDWMLEREADGKPTFPKSPKTCGYMGGCAHHAACMRYPNWQVGYRKKGDKPTVEQMLPAGKVEQLTMTEEDVF